MKRIAPLALFATALSLAACQAVDAGLDTDTDADSELDPPVAEAAQALQTVTPFSVIIASDPQFWWSKYNFTGAIDDACPGSPYDDSGLTDDDQEELGYETNRNQVKAMNALAADDASFGYRAPKQVIVNGDLTEFARTKQWNAYEDEYPGKLVVPVFPGLGNHDYGHNVHGDCWASVGDYDWYSEYSNWCGNNSRRKIESWVDDHREDLESFDPGSVAYSWVKNGIRFVQLHHYAAYEEPDFRIAKSTPWLRSQLADAVAHGQRVVLNMHEFGNKHGDPGAEEDQELIDAITGFEYNVVGIFAGHVHETAGHRGDVTLHGVKIPWYRSGSATWNFFLLVQFEQDRMIVTVVDSGTGSPIAIPFDADFRNPYVESCGPVAAHVTAPHQSFYPKHPCIAGLQPDAPLVGGECKGTCSCEGVPAHRITTAELAGGSEADDQLGSAVATGDFNGDGKADLAIGAPYEDIDGHDDAGAVNVVYGSIYGLARPNNQMWDQGSDGVPGSVEGDDRFGYALAAGDFNGDGFDDLAIGAPGEDVDGYNDAGAVFALHGSASGLRATGTFSAQGWDQNAPNVAGGCESQDGFGWSMAAGDFNGDGNDDLAIGVPHEDLAGGDDGGMVHVFRGTSSGLSAAGDPGFDQDSANVAGSVEINDRFGWSLAAGDFNGDGKADLAIGVPHEDLAGGDDGGTIHVFRGTTSGLSPVLDPGFNQDSSGVAGSVETNDRFGWSLAAGDFNSDGKDDLAVGAPHDDIGSHDDAGIVHVFTGSLFGLVTSGDPGFNQDSTSVAGVVETNDRFGWSLAAGDFNGDGKDDLAVGTPFEDLAGGDDGGTVHLFRGTAAGLSAQYDPGFTQDSSFVEGAVQADDRFGYALAAGDFNGDGKADLAIGVPREDLGYGGGDDAGVVNVLYSAATSTPGQIWSQGW
ncbi:hypothetical protein [Sorangium sp. So ce887]|uniref:hypothetical protein n=1 Tax=Sorangium sp. So ce887 TaxID=3133324 RepID=UPI003F616010